jgi:hypothetical protein
LREPHEIVTWFPLVQKLLKEAEQSMPWQNAWCQLGDPNFGDGFTLPLNTPITAVSRKPSHVDLLAVGKDGAVYTTSYDDNGGWIGRWLPLIDPNFGDGFTLPLKTPIAAVSRVPSHLDVYAVGKDTRIYHKFYDDTGGWDTHWSPMVDPNFGDGFTLPLNTPISALSDPHFIFQYAVYKDTAVYSQGIGDLIGPSGWHRIGDPSFGDDFTLPLNTPIAAVLQNRKPGDRVFEFQHDQDLIAVGKDTAVYWTFHDNVDLGHPGWRQPNFPTDFTLPLNTPIAAVSRFYGHLDLVAVRFDSAVYRTFYDFDGGWNGQWLPLRDPNFDDDFTLPLNTPIAAVSRFPSHLDLFAVGKDTRVYSTFYDDNGGWSGQWFPIVGLNFNDRFTLPLNTPIAAVSRFPSRLELFAVGKDTRVYTTFYDDNFNPKNAAVFLQTGQDQNGVVTSLIVRGQGFTPCGKVTVNYDIHGQPLVGPQPHQIGSVTVDVDPLMFFQTQIQNHILTFNGADVKVEDVSSGQTTTASIGGV